MLKATSLEKTDETRQITTKPRMSRSSGVLTHLVLVMSIVSRNPRPITVMKSTSEGMTAKCCIPEMVKPCPQAVRGIEMPIDSAGKIRIEPFISRDVLRLREINPKIGKLMKNTRRASSILVNEKIRTATRAMKARVMDRAK